MLTAMNAPATCPRPDQRDLDRLDYEARFVTAVQEGLDDYDAGRFVTDEELGIELDAMFGALPEKRR